MNVKYISLAAARNSNKSEFDGLFKRCFTEACSQLSKEDLISALCDKPLHGIKMKLAA